MKIVNGVCFIFAMVMVVLFVNQRGQDITYLALALLLVAASFVADAQIEQLKRQEQIMHRLKIIGNLLQSATKASAQPQPESQSEPQKPVVVDLQN